MKFKITKYQLSEPNGEDRYVTPCLQAMQSNCDYYGLKLSGFERSYTDNGDLIVKAIID